MFESKLPIKKIYEMELKERQDFIVNFKNLNSEEQQILSSFGKIDRSFLLLSENVISGFLLPFSIATHFRVNNKDYLVPMVTEEASVVAAASFGAKMTQRFGGFTTNLPKSTMTGQIQIISKNEVETEKKIMANKDSIIKSANISDPNLISLGGGMKDIEIKKIITSRGKMMILHIFVDVVDAMGANIVTKMAEKVGEHLKTLIDDRILLKIISNLPIHRIVKCKGTFDKNLLGGEDVVNKILDAYAFAESDPSRAVTHNKGIMNGITAIALATGNDTRAMEAGAHSYAAMDGNYKPLSRFFTDSEYNLVGELALPLSLGTVGGITQIHKMSKIALKILGIRKASELNQVACAVGLAQNVAALRALVCEGIYHSHKNLKMEKLASNV